MKEYVILTDATCDLPPDLLDEMGIGVIPMEFEMNGEIFTHYPDARQMGLHEFYERIRQGQMPKTTQINRSEYEKYFESVLCKMCIRDRSQGTAEKRCSIRRNRNRKS